MGSGAREAAALALPTLTQPSPLLLKSSVSSVLAAVMTAEE